MQRDRAVAAVVRPAGGAAERGEQVLGAPHQRHHIGFGRDGGGVDDARRRLAERNHAVALKLLELGGAFGLGQHDVPVGGVLEAVQVLLELFRAGRVDPDDRAARVQLGDVPGGAELGEDGAAGPLLVRRRDGVLEVHDHGVGALGGLLVPLGAVGGAEQQGGAHQETHDVYSALLCALRGPAECASRVHIRQLRVARATTVAVLVPAGVLHGHDPLAGAGGGQPLSGHHRLRVQGVAVVQRVREGHVRQPQLGDDGALGQLRDGLPHHRGQGEHGVHQALAERLLRRSRRRQGAGPGCSWSWW